MTTDEQLHERLRAAVPPADADPPLRDLWPEIVRQGRAPIAMSRLDLGLAAGLAAALLLFPRVAWLLAYHL